jgi:hypothetical protein
MTTNYKTDDSFFIGIYPPFIYHGLPVKKWFINSSIAKFRFIRDFEVENEFSNLKQVLELYPGIRTVGIVLNPWARMRQAFINFNEIKAAGNTKYVIDVNLLNLIELDDFNKFVIQLSNFPTDNQLWFNMITPLMEWLSCTTDDNNIITSDYILRGEHLVEDFKPIQDYFCSEVPLIPNPAIEYKEFYNSNTKKIISKLFEQDIDQFKYKF